VAETLLPGEVNARAYAESYGAVVDWDEATGEVIVNGYRVMPSNPFMPTAHASQAAIDEILIHEGLKAPPGVNRTISDVIGGPVTIPWITDVYERAKAWVIAALWQPILDYWQVLETGIERVKNGVLNLPFTLWGYIQGVGVRFLNWASALQGYAEDVSNWVYGQVFPPLSGVIDYIGDIRGKLGILLTDAWDKLLWLTSGAFDNLKAFFSDPIGYSARLVISGFAAWIKEVDDLVTGYITDHWEDEL
jgi:hypothetical protein